MRLKTFLDFNILSSFLIFSASAQSMEELQQKILRLESKLSQTQVELQKIVKQKDEQPSSSSDSATIAIGPLTIGGAIRVNYVIGDYNRNGAGPSRGGHGGNFELDTFRVNTDLSYKQWVGKSEYRFYNGYNFLHTGWLGYNFKDGSQIQAGVNRVPFGPGAWGISQSWFFDQHYYVGLSDDMDAGFKYTRLKGNLKLDLAFYIQDEGHWRGASEDSARYSYDVVNEGGNGYEESNQFNIRAIYSLAKKRIPTDLGVSAQYSMLESSGPQEDGEHWAASVHMVNQWKNWKLATQWTLYEYNIDRHPVQSGEISSDLIDFGAFDFAYPVAAKASIPAVSLSYQLETSNIKWLDYMIPYIEYSAIIKDETRFNDSELITIGIAWARKNWYIYTDWAYSNGNFFVGNETFTEFGVNPNNEWQNRFNLNFGYYF